MIENKIAPQLLALVRDQQDMDQVEFAAKHGPCCTGFGIRVDDPEAAWEHIMSQGGKDFETDPVKDLNALSAAARKYKRDATIQRFPDLDHHFKHEDGVSNQTSYLEARPVDAAFLDALVKWTKKVASASPSKAKPKSKSKK